MQMSIGELLHIINGDVSPERLQVLLDRLDECPESAAALQVLVTLRANRQKIRCREMKTLEILRLEELHDLDSEPPPGYNIWKALWALLVSAGAWALAYLGYRWIRRLLF